MKLLHTKAASSIAPVQNLCSSNSSKHLQKCIITQLKLTKSQHFHSFFSSSTSTWKLIIIKKNGFHKYGKNCPAISGIGVLAAAVVLSTPPPSEETLSNVPPTLGQSCDSNTDPKECEGVSKKRIQKPKSRNAESCTSKCVTTCIRGGDGEGPLNVRGPIVVFKQGFRSRQYCLVECSDICNLLDDADKGR